MAYDREDGPSEVSRLTAVTGPPRQPGHVSKQAATWPHGKVYKLIARLGVRSLESSKLNS